MSSQEQRRIQQVEAALTLVREGEMSAAMSRLHSLGIADLTPGVLQQLIAKHPTRDHSVPDALPVHALPAVDPLDLTDIFRGLRRRAGTGPSGRRNEHLRALVGDYADSRADRVEAVG